MYTFGTGGFGSAVGGPGGLLTPPHNGGCSDAQEVDGVWLKVFQEVLGLLSRHLQLSDSMLCTGTVGQAVS